MEIDSDPSLIAPDNDNDDNDSNLEVQVVTEHCRMDTVDLTIDSDSDVEVISRSTFDRMDMEAAYRVLRSIQHPGENTRGETAPLINEE